jgi:nitronate monooxygenase
LTHHLPDSEPNFVAALDEQVPVMLFSFADPTPWVRRAKETGVLTICQVQSMEDAALAATAGADVLAVQGNEAGGHTGRANLLPFLVQAIEAFPAIPVIAAGGITSGRALAAVLAAGAEGAWMGTLFTAVVEADELSPLHKEAVVASDGRDTVYSAAYDIVSDRAFGGPPWPARIATRAKLNPFLQQWLGREAALTEHADELVGDMRRAYRSADPALMPLLYGEGAGAITTVRTSREVVTEICADAGRLLQDRSSIVD